MTIDLVRVSVAPQGVFGVLLAGGLPFAVTLEHSYADGKPVKIPDGEWECRESRFYRGGYATYEILVPGHSRLLFHKGNYEKDTEGCILVAKSFEGDWIAGSKAGFEEFMRRTGGADSFQLRVRSISISEEEEA